MYFTPPGYPPPQFSPRQRHNEHQFGPPSALHSPLDPMTGLPVQTSMNQWIPSGNTFPGVPSSQTPLLPFASGPFFPFEMEADTDDLKEL